MIWEIVKAEAWHIPRIAKDMKPEDVKEVWASHGHTPKQALEASLNRSAAAWTCLVNNVPAFMWGVAPADSVLGHKGCPWLLGSDAIKEVRYAFIRRCRKYIDLMQELYPVLENYVHKDNLTSIGWLIWCGFTLADEPEEYGVNSEKFYRFWRF